MTTCQECNSEISEIEAFCPYCGIKIDRPAPAAEPTPVVDESFESTIVISPSEAAIMRENMAVDSEGPTATPDPVIVDDIPPTPAILTSDFPQSTTDPSIAIDADRGTFESKAEDENAVSGFVASPPPSPFSAGGTDLGSFSFAAETAEEEVVEPESPAEEPVSKVAESGYLPAIEAPASFPEAEPDPELDALEEKYASEETEEPVVEQESVSDPESAPVFEPVSEPETLDEPEPIEESVAFEAADPDPIAYETPEPELEEPEVPAYEEPAAEEADEEEPAELTPLVEEPSVEEPAAFAPSQVDEPVVAAEEPAIEPEAEVAAPDEEHLEELNPGPIAEELPADSSEEPAAFISRPADDLQEPQATPSVFDSVRIMEGVETSGPPQPPANIQPIVTEAATNSGEMAAVSDPGTQSGLGSPDTDGRKAAKLKPLPEGAVLNKRYEVVRKIGGGGMGAVYLASDNNLGGVLRAVKEMVQAHIEEDQQEKAINDFKRESTILSTLDHPSIPTIYDYFYDADEGRFYLVMKYISGGDLASKLRSSPDGKIEELTATEWAIQITDVLNYLHNQPTTIVYRDLKPSNIMLDGNTGRAMLIDFGIARSITQKEEKGVTAVGTMGYAPPELFSGNVEPRSDIYSLGSTLFHLLTGADPQSNPLLIFDFQKNPRPRQINSRLSDQMERILMRTVEYNADQRFASAAELKAVLEDHLANLRSGNLTYGVTEAPVSISLENQSVFCGFCGQRIVATDLFCAFCGSKQPLAQQGVHSEIYRHSAVTARLVIEGTSELSAPVFSLQKDESLIGRRDPMSNIFPEVDLSKYDPQTKISRRHAKIWRDGTSFMIEDLGSSNGTLVEGPSANLSRLPAHQPYKLSSGDRIKIGDTSLHFVVG